MQNTLCFKKSMLVVADVFAQQVLNEYSNIVGEPVVQTAAKVLVSGWTVSTVGERGFCKRYGLECV